MPNHCTNTMTITSPRIQSILEDLKQDDEEFEREKAQAAAEAAKYEEPEPEYQRREFDFNRLIPMPRELRDTVSGSTMIDGERVDVWRERVVDGKVVAEKVDADDLVRRYGAKSWYEWANRRWGTKWNAYDVRIERGVGVANISFTTAWAPPYPIFAELARKHHCDVTVTWEEEGGGSGFYTHIDGVETVG